MAFSVLFIINGLNWILKRSQNDITKDVYDSVCSFNNRIGGHIILGVTDEKEIIGVNSQKIDRMLKDFTTAINNANKMYPPIYLTPMVYEMEDKKLIYIRVLEGMQVSIRNFTLAVRPCLKKVIFSKSRYQ